MVIIGWDDNYSKELFQVENIEGNGAFICVNSWGTDFGFGGVFYISYYDDCIGTNSVCYTRIEDIDNYDNIYQSDLCGWTGTMGFQEKNTAYFVRESRKFAIIVKISKKDDKDTAQLIPVEMLTEGVEDKIDLSDGEGYFSSAGYYWSSAEKQNCNICLKAYTIN